MRQHRGERCRRTRRLARQQGVHRQIPAQTQRPSAQGANARNQHTHSTGAHNANMHSTGAHNVDTRNSMVAIWAHRARSRRAQGAIAQGVIAQGAIAQGMAAQASTHRARRRAPSAESCERFHYRGRSDDKTARAHRGHSTGGQTCARRPRTSMARHARTARARTRCAQATGLRSDTYDPLLQGFGGCPRASAAAHRAPRFFTPRVLQGVAGGGPSS